MRIGMAAFYGCTDLTSINIPTSLSECYSDTFEGCTSLASFTGGSSEYQVSADGRLLIHVYNDEFVGESRLLVSVAKFGLESITIPNWVANIRDYTFEYCTTLQSVTFEGDGRTADLTIGYRAFGDCSNLATVNFVNWPSSGVTVDMSAGYIFENCDPNIVVNAPANTVYGD